MRTADLTTTFNQPLGKTHPITTEERETGNLNCNSLVALVSDLGPLQRCQEIPSSFPPASQFQLKKKKKKSFKANLIAPIFNQILPPSFLKQKINGKNGHQPRIWTWLEQSEWDYHHWAKFHNLWPVSENKRTKFWRNYFSKVAYT